MFMESCQSQKWLANWSLNCPPLTLYKIFRDGHKIYMKFFGWGDICFFLVLLVRPLRDPLLKEKGEMRKNDKGQFQE